MMKILTMNVIKLSDKKNLMVNNFLFPIVKLYKSGQYLLRK